MLVIHRKVPTRRCIGKPRIAARQRRTIEDPTPCRHCSVSKRNHRREERYGEIVYFCYDGDTPYEAA